MESPELERLTEVLTKIKSNLLWESGNTNLLNKYRKKCEKDAAFVERVIQLVDLFDKSEK
jgi:hypothetical protein